MADCDVAIIGAGVIGASIAYELASRGIAPRVFDVRSPGQGATQAAAGMLVPYIEGFGKPILDMAVSSLAMYDEFIRRIETDGATAVEYHRSGSLQVATTGESTDELVALESTARAAGVRCTLLDAHRVHELEPLISPNVAAGLFIPDHGVVVPASLSRALTLAATRRGARFETGQSIERVARRSDGTFGVKTSSGCICAERVVVAGGSWSGQLPVEGLAPLPVRPVRGQLVHLTSDIAIRRSIWGAGCYLAPSIAGSVSVGATMEDAGFDERNTVAGVRGLLDAAVVLLPALAHASFSGARVGLRPATPDELPIIGRSTVLPGLFCATGHFRNGILLAPLTARVLADLILDNREDSILEVTSPQRFGEY